MSARLAWIDDTMAAAVGGADLLISQAFPSADGPPRQGLQAVFHAYFDAGEPREIEWCETHAQTWDACWGDAARTGVQVDPMSCRCVDAWVTLTPPPPGASNSVA